MFEDYKRDLLKFFLIRKENHQLPDNLELLGRERLKKECIEVFLRKKSQKDKDFIKSVFDPKNEFEDQFRSIEKFDLDKFRPLINFLTEKVKTIRDDKLVKLFAWLIDFPAYSEWRDLNEQELKLIFEEAAKKPEEEEEITEPIGDVKVPDNIFIPPPIVIIGKPTGGSNGEDVTQPEQPKEPVYVPKFSPRYIVISCIILLFIGSSSFVAWENSTISVRMPKADEKCMYWNEDHYEPVKCNAQIANATITPLDLKKLQRQRKINLSDTLTSYSLGKVWYKGFVKDHEFFTDSGAYPQDIQRVLKPLTNTILTKYTSNYRYLLTRLVWFICAAFFISICGFAVSKLEKEVKAKDESQQQDPEVVLTLEEEPMVEQTEGSFAT